MSFLDPRRLAARAREALGVARGLASARPIANLRPAGLADLAVRVARRDVDPAYLFRAHALNIGARTAVIASDKTLTYAELDRSMNRIAHVLRAQGIGPNDHVAVMLPNSAAWIECLGGVSRLRAKIVAVGYRLSPREIAHMLTDAECKLFLFGAQFAERVAEAAREAAFPFDRLLAIADGQGARVPAGIAALDERCAAAPAEAPPRDRRRGRAGVIIYTSGTTGKPKGAVRGMGGGIVDFLLSIYRALPVRAGDVHLTASPLYHSLAWAFVTVGFSLGDTQVLLEHWDPEEALRAMARHGVNTTAMVPTMLKDLADLPPAVRARHDVSALRGIFASGARLGADLRAEVMAAFGPKLYDLYGATEYGFVIYAGPEQMKKNIGALGVAFPGCEIRLLGDDGREVGEGEVGEVFVRNTMIFEGYYKRPDATAAGARGGFYSVGDMARRDADGYFTLADRKTDMIVSGGANVYSAEVEAALHEHPGIDEAAVIGVPDERLQEAVKAYVVLEPGAVLTGEEVQAFCATRIASFKKPRHVEFVRYLPKNPTGKILKRDLREWHKGARPADADPAWTPAVATAPA
ncbi:MAG TPA: AMP-binding protein [Myxococcota bacterium]|jgi:fatty-acyl-CoA synthase|nr:AMP-binding protein [Myxococcota bacterium]